MPDITPNGNLTDIDSRIAREIDAIKTEGNKRLISIDDLATMATETHLVLLLEAACGYAPIHNSEVMTHLASQYYSDIHPSRGGLAWDSYNQYARVSTRVKEAAARHRKYIENPKTKH